MTRTDQTAGEQPRRQALLEVLRTSDTPLGVTQLADRLRIHPNTVRFHLDALVRDALIDRRLEQPTGPGRPRTVYTPHPGMDRGGQRQYHLLAKILLGQLSTDPDAGGAAEAAGRTWGGHLVDQVAPTRQPGVAEATHRLTAMMTDLGFAPEPEGDPAERIRLRHCPFLELAEEYSSTLCPLHLGLMRGALTAIRAPITATSLEPFAERDACIAHLSPTRAHPPQTANRSA
ncbi:helix-turn-helix domain-containing protein [Kribbella sp. NPDC023855]|uniref:helix-turn-helix transcriptional regulator n=1 Tax=Kribbella sp. NPDC023855 TaxID=3154698 RepID=UPI003402F786